MAKQSQKTADLAALRYAGAMGHTYATVRTYGDGRTDCSGQYSSLHSVRRFMDAEDRVYKRSPDGKHWRRASLCPVLWRVKLTTDPRRLIIVPGQWPATVIGDGVVKRATCGSLALHEVSDETGVSRKVLTVDGA
jgi:hypothetical protein